MASKNVMAKSRKRGNPYLVFSGPFGEIQVLKSWQADNAKPYGRWFVYVNGDMGDSYVHDIVKYGTLLDYDRTVFTPEEINAVVRQARQAPAPSF